MEDLLLAIQAREAYNFIQPPAQSVSLSTAEFIHADWDHKHAKIQVLVDIASLQAAVCSISSNGPCIKLSTHVTFVRCALDLEGAFLETQMLTVYGRQVISGMAAQRNKQPLPDLSDRPGLIIPGNSLLGPGYQLTVPSDERLSPAEAQPNTVPMQNGSSKPALKSKAVINFNISQPMEEG